MPPQYAQLPRSSLDSSDHDHDHDYDYDHDHEFEFKDKPILRPYPFCFHLPPKFSSYLSFYLFFALTLVKKTRRFFRPVYLISAFLVLLILQTTFNASYTNPPPFVPNERETVYIAANIIDGDLITGPWGEALVDLVKVIGPERVYVSIYGGPGPALKELASKLDKLEFAHSIVDENEHPIPLSSIPHTKLPTGEERIKRIAYLAEVRNRALDPLQLNAPNTSTSLPHTQYDRILFINDIFFSASDALRLLWGTNINSVTGEAEYKAVCAADFVSSWKMYDTYGTRDFDGYSLGVPFFPWFAYHGGGEGVSRRDVLEGKDAVRVKSCWGGMVAFDGRYFNPQNTLEKKAEQLQLPLRFRSEPEPFWDASECCLIHADILALPPFPSYSQEVTPSKPVDWDDGIFMNPYVRVTYDASSGQKIWLIKRIERVFAPLQRVVSYFAGMPRFNYRRGEKEGMVVDDKVWVANPTFKQGAGVGEKDSEKADGKTVTRKIGEGRMGKRATLGHEKGKAYWGQRGHYEEVKRTATRGGYCGVRQLLVLKEGGDGEGNWDNLLDMVPPLDV